MILDGLLQFSASQSLAQAVGTYVSTNIIDLGIAGLPTSAAGGGARDLGIGDNPAMKLLVEASAAFASGGAGTLQVQLLGAPDNGAGAPGAFTIMSASQVYPLAALISGARLFDIDMPRPAQGQPLPRYLELNYVIAGATMTAGAVSAYLLGDRYDQVRGVTGLDSAYPPGLNIPN